MYVTYKICVLLYVIRVASKEGKRNKRMMCDCQFDPGNGHVTILYKHYMLYILLVICVSFDCLYMYLIICIEVDDASEACGENCLNRLLMIEW